MSRALLPSAVGTWYGAFLLDGSTVVRRVLAPTDPESARARTRLRRAGDLTPEEETLLADRGAVAWRSRDRRLASRGLEFDPHAPGAPPRNEQAGALDVLRLHLLAEGQVALEQSWDPSVHVQEAVRALADLDRARNLVGERLGSWVARDRPEVDPGDHARAARVALEEGTDRVLAPAGPMLADARKRLAQLYRSIEGVRGALSDAVDASSPQETPNLCALLGPELAARMVAQAGGLARLARLPSSTVQVLGAERAFFEHLRGRAPPPRHGLLFTHAAIQSASRRERGKLARALAGKVAIAARLDQAGAPVAPSLARAFDARRAEVAAQRTAGRRARGKSVARLPLDRTARDR